MTERSYIIVRCAELLIKQIQEQVQDVYQREEITKNEPEVVDEDCQYNRRMGLRLVAESIPNKHASFKLKHTFSKKTGELHNLYQKTQKIS